MKGSHKNTEASLKRFGNHRCLSQSEESKCMWTHGKDGALWVLDVIDNTVINNCDMKFL